MLSLFEIVLKHASHSIELEGLPIIRCVLLPLVFLLCPLVSHLLIEPLLLHSFEVFSPRIKLQILSIELSTARDSFPVLPVWMITEKGLFSPFHLIVIIIDC